MISSYVLDTSALLILLRGKDLGDQIDREFGLRASPHLHTLSIVTHEELRVLADRNGWAGARAEALAKALREFVTVDVSGSGIVEAYRQIEQINAGMPAGHQNMGKNDVWIAATALITGLPLITTDTDFNHLNGKIITVHYVNPQSTQP